MSLSFDAARAAISPRPYQRELQQALIAATTPIAPGQRSLIHVATGGGKRLILNDFLAARVLEAPDMRAIVLAKDWNLVVQLAEDLVQRHRRAIRRISVLGNPPDPSVFAPARRDARGRIVFTTLQTWMARRESLSQENFQLVVLDESHWAERASFQRALYDAYSSAAAFIGATATPLVGSQYQLVGRSYGFTELVELGVLARPVLTTIETGTAWEPRRGSSHGDFLGSSLAQLGLDPLRNRRVADVYKDGRPSYGKTIVFACTIPHAELLVDAFSARGVRAAAMHHTLPADTNAKVLERFRASELDVVVNVAMLTHGIDIPDVKSVFLTRPTTSGVLLAQMIGRAARRTENKDTFNIVSFADSIVGNVNEIARPETFVGPSARVVRTRCPPIHAHSFVPGAFKEIAGGPEREVLEGLEINELQTFGIEFEAARLGGATLGFDAGAAALLEALRPAVPTALTPMDTPHSAQKDNTVWNAEPDPSCGFEVTSRILRGEAGLGEVVDACRVLEKAFERLGLTVNRRCVGTHVHVGADLDRQQITHLLAITAWFEPAIISLVPPSRADVVFVRTVRPFLRRLVALPEDADWRLVVAHSPKYLGVNVSGLVHGYGTVEVRFHSGTANAGKILQWICLWMRIIDAARRGACPGDPLRDRATSRPLCTGPRGDVAALCAFVGAGAKLTERLIARRDEVVGRAWVNHPLFGDAATRVLEHWYRRDDRGPSSEIVPR